MSITTILKKTLALAGLEVKRIPPRPLPDDQFYAPLFSPWLGHGDFKEIYAAAAPYTLVSADRCYVIYTLGGQALHLAAEFWECGVYSGGTAILLNAVASARSSGVRLRLFDTFEGMPEADPEKDLHRRADFSDTSLEAVRARLPEPEMATFHSGLIPGTFAGLEDCRIALAHVDVDLYQSVLDCCVFIYPRLVAGGFLVFDDYGFPTCPGARQAVDEFFRDTPERPLVLPTGQAIVFKMDEGTRGARPLL